RRGTGKDNRCGSKWVTYGSTLRARVVEVDAVQELDALAQGGGGARGGDVGEFGGAGAGAVGGGGAGRGQLLPDFATRRRIPGAGGARRLPLFVLHPDGRLPDVGADASGAGRRRALRADADAALPGVARQA